MTREPDARGATTPPTRRSRSAPAARPRRADPPRQVAFDLLTAVREQDAYANLALPRLLRAARLSGRDAAFATELAYGALRGRGTYDAVLAACVDRPLPDIDAPVLDALRLGAHQLLAMRVPAHAAVSETVALVRGSVGAGAGGFTNAVLRRVGERDLGEWLERVAPDAADDPTGALAVRTSHPEWIVRAFRGALASSGRPADELADLLAADNDHPLVALAALPGLVEPDELVALGARPGRWSPRAVVLPGGDPGDLAPVAAARTRVADEASQLAALALLAAPVSGEAAGDHDWADLCAGPGGKAALLAASAAAAPGAHLRAVEVAPHRAELIRSALAAIDGSAFTVVTGDGRDVGSEAPASFDRVLVDVPCTGLGALRRRPEARWRRSPADLAALAPLQRALLASALDAVRPGGVVGYVTCSPHPAETTLVVDDVLRRRDDVVRLDTPSLLRAAARKGSDLTDLGEGTGAQMWPHRHGTDAIFVALLRRT